MFDLERNAIGFGGYVGFLQGDIYEVQLARIRGREVEIIARYLGASITLVGRASGSVVRGDFSLSVLGDRYEGKLKSGRSQTRRATADDPVARHGKSVSGTAAPGGGHLSRQQSGGRQWDSR